MKKDNLILIGMPGAGKSTVGVVVAKRLGYEFVDSDLVIQKQYQKLLQELIEERGIEGFWALENQVNTGLATNHCVIATGGSAVYGKEAMEHFRELGRIVYLKLSYGEIEERLGDLTARGVTIRPGQSLQELYDERAPLYQQYADVTVECDGKSLQSIVLEVTDLR